MANSLREQGIAYDMVTLGSRPRQTVAMPAEGLVPAQYRVQVEPPQRPTSALCRQIQETVRHGLAKIRIVHPGRIIVNATGEAQTVP
jgi:hypothetical protein